MGVIRGAVCVVNTEKDISDRAVELVRTIIDENRLSAENIQAVIFTATSDITACYPARAVRERLGLDKAAFMCLAEMSVRDSLPLCLRVSVFVEGLPQLQCRHCYLGAAAALRPDCAVGEE